MPLNKLSQILEAGTVLVLMSEQLRQQLVQKLIKLKLKTEGDLKCPESKTSEFHALVSDMMVSVVA